MPAISNLFILREGKLMTPPLSSGVLPGIFRRHLLENNVSAVERVLHLEDLAARVSLVHLVVRHVDHQGLRASLLGDLLPIRVRDCGVLS